MKIYGMPPARKRLLDRTVALTGPKVAKDGGSCSGATAAGALQRATKGRWRGTWDSEYSDYEVVGIKGVTLPFNSKSKANWYWSFLVDGKEASAGICAVPLKKGEVITFEPACYGSACPKSGKAARIDEPAEPRRRR